LFTYQEVENAIARLHHVPSARTGTFKARIRNFQRVGLIPSSPGKGLRIRYDIEDVIRWALCFEFSEIGLLPEQIKRIFTCSGWTLFRPFEGPVTSDDYLFCLLGNFLEWHLNKEDKQSLDHEELVFDVVRASRISRMIIKNEYYNRILIINMTALKRKLGQELNINWDYKITMSSKDGSSSMVHQMSIFRAFPLR